MKRRASRRRFRTTASAVLLTTALAGCGGESSSVPIHVPLPRTADLVADHAAALTSSSGRATVESFFCRDQRRFGLVLEPGEEVAISLDVAVGVEPHFTVEGCLRRTVPEAGSAAGSGLVLAFEDDVGETLREERLEARPGWWSHGLALPELTGESGVRIRLRSEAAASYGIFLDEVFLEHLEVGERPATQPPQVLLISVDTLRADGLSALGGPWPSPHLDALAERGTVFAPHYAAANWTKPSHASLLTGELTAVHGVDRYEAVIAEGLPTVAERLRQEGVSTGALVYDCKHLEPRFGFARGFDDYRVEPWTPGTAGRWVADWIVEHRDRPFFFFFHLFDPHSDFDQLSYEGPGVDHTTVERRFGVADYGCTEDDVCASIRLVMINRGEVEPLENEREILEYLYGAGVTETDAALGALFELLERAALLENLTVILTSDHGEELFEHGGVLHEGSWDVVLQVPMVVKWPGDARAGGRVAVPTGALDVAPTVLARFDLAAEGLPGRDLWTVAEVEPVFSGIEEWMVREGRFKLIEQADGEARLYDLEADPGETRDLSAERPELVERLRALIVERRRSDLERGATLERPTSALSDEERELLEALGYLSDDVSP